MNRTWIIVGACLILAYVYFEADGSLGTDDGSDGSTDGGSDTSTTTGNAISDFISAWAHAIAPAENVNPNYNDPGGLNEVGDAGSVPATGGGVIGVFSTIDAGYSALESVLAGYIAKYPDLTLQGLWFAFWC